MVIICEDEMRPPSTQIISLMPLNYAGTGEDAGGSADTG